MAVSKVTVVISQGQGRNPVRRQLEEDIATALLTEPGVDVSLVPHLYDMSHDHTGQIFLRSVPGNLIVLSWLYDRAARWTLDRAGVRGHEGLSLLKSAEEDAEGEDDDEPASNNGNGIGSVSVPNRRVYAIDLRCSAKADDFIREVRRIAGENTVQTVELMSWIGGAPKAEQLQRYLQPERMLEARRAFDSGNATLEDKAVLPEDTGRRWYPVIDYSRCTNCMEFWLSSRTVVRKAVRRAVGCARKTPSSSRSIRRRRLPEPRAKSGDSKLTCQNYLAATAVNPQLTWLSKNAIEN